MSVIYSNSFSAFISHEMFVNRLIQQSYKNDSFSLVINTKLFQINSPYLRSNQNTQNINDDMKVIKRKRKSKRFETSDYMEMEEIVKDVKDNYENFLAEILKDECEIFKCKDLIMDNNKLSTDFVQKFYNNTHMLKAMKGGNSSDSLIIVNIENNEYIIPPNCQFYNNDIRKIDNFFDFDRTFDLVILDPPWWNKYIRRLKTADNSCSYSMLENKDILDIPIEKLTNVNSLVIIWCTNSKTHIDAVKKQFLPKWNLKFITTWYWLKVTNMGKTICQFRKPFDKQPFEQIIIACHQDRILDDQLLKDIEKMKIIISVPSAIHSHKPPLLELLSPFLKDSPKCLEIFARNLLPNFTSIGLEVLKLQSKSLFVEVV